ncbi:MAG TPA: hypothetical protein VNK95_11670, partial [Caldilineaceae bacterium]|nr:hypothetical protein [Caldilineaceae bacterium]
MRRLTFRIDRYLLLLFGLSLLALAPLAAPGYFYSAHDGRHSVFFVAMFDEAIRSGALWPRWAMHHNQGYGYPTFVVQAPLAFYLAELFVLLGAGVTTAVKLAWAVGFLAGAWGMYALVKAWLLGSLQPDGNTGSPEHPRLVHYASLCAVAAGLLYSYAPYHLLDMYVRAAFAETWMMAWFPWVFLAFDRLIAQGSRAGWQGRLAAAALSYAGLLLTHVFALVAFTPLLAAFILFRLWMAWRREPPHGPLVGLVRRTALAAGAGIAGLLLAAVFLVPLFAEGPLLVQEDWTQDTYHYTRHWVYWGQFLSPFWGYGYSDDPAGANDSMGFQLGLMLVLPALIGGYLLLARREPPPGEARLYPLMRFLLLASLVVLAVVTPGAAALWRSMPALEVIQFPWRLLALTAFLLSALGGLTFWQLAQAANLLPQPADDGGVLVMALLICAAGWAYSRPAALQPVEPWREDGRAVMQFEQEHPDMFGFTRFVEQRFTESPLTAQYLAALNTPADFSPDSLERLAIIAGEGEVARHYSRGHAFGGEVRMATPGVVQIRLFEFPGWQVRLNGQPVAHRVSPPYGLMEVDVPAGAHRIDVWMGATPARTAGALTSGITLLAL